MADLKLQLTPQAEDDIAAIWDYTFEAWSRGQADRYLASINAAFDLLAAMPDIARARTEYTPPIRIHPSGSHLILYRVDGDVLRISRVLHRRQNWQILFEGQMP